MSILVASPCPEITFEELGIKNWPIWIYEANFLIGFIMKRFAFS